MFGVALTYNFSVNGRVEFFFLVAFPVISSISDYYLKEIVFF